MDHLMKTIESIRDHLFQNRFVHILFQKIIVENNYAKYVLLNIFLKRL